MTVRSHCKITTIAVSTLACALLAGIPGIAATSDGSASTVRPVRLVAEAAPSPTVTINDDTARGRALKKLAPTIEADAGFVGVDGQTLARIIYHEGGNYLSIRRGARAAIEHLQPPTGSVGIAQVKAVPTARSVLQTVYKDQLAEALSDEQLRDRLIDDDAFAIKIAAGYLRELQDAGITGDWPQFMAYSLSPSQAANWKAAGHPMSVDGLRAAGFEDDGSHFSDFRLRQQKFNDAKDAIG